MSGTMNNPVSQPTPPSGNESPVVTEGRAGTGGPYEDFFSAYRRLQELNKPAPPPPGPMGITPSQQRSLDQLGAFGAALASTRSPNFMGAFGEGLRAVQQTEATQRGELRQEQQDDRQRQQANMEAAYRAAQEARQAAEMRYNQRPDNYANLLAVARTRDIESQIAERIRRASIESQTERLGQPVLVETAPGVFAAAYPGARGAGTTPVIRPLGGTPLTARVAEQRSVQGILDDIQRAADAEGRSFDAIMGRTPSTLTPEQIRAQRDIVVEEARRREAVRRGLDPAIAERLRTAAPPTPAPTGEIRPRAF